MAAGRTTWPGTSTATGSSTTAPRRCPTADIPRESHLSHTFTTPGIYRISAKAKDGHGNILVVMQTLTVRAGGGRHHCARAAATFVPGVEDQFIVRAPGGVALTFDLDGDGDFDDTAPVYGGARGLTLTHPATVAVKATVGASSVVHSVELSPLTGNLGPFPQIAPLPPYGFPAGLPPFVAGYTTRLTAYIQDLDSICCGHFSLFDTDDDGTFDDQRDFQPGVGRHTLVLKGGDGTRSPPCVRRSPWPARLSRWTRERIRGGPRRRPRPSRRRHPRGTRSLRSSSRSSRSSTRRRGVTLRTTCSAACRTTIVVKLGSKTLARKTGKGGAVTVKFSAKVRRQLAKARGRKLTITLSAPGAKSVSKTVKVNR